MEISKTNNNLLVTTSQNNKGSLHKFYKKNNVCAGN